MGFNGAIFIDHDRMKVLHSMNAGLWLHYREAYRSTIKTIVTLALGSNDLGRDMKYCTCCTMVMLSVVCLVFSRPVYYSHGWQPWPLVLASMLLLDTRFLNRLAHRHNFFRGGVF